MTKQLADWMSGLRSRNYSSRWMLYDHEHIQQGAYKHFLFYCMLSACTNSQRVSPLTLSCDSPPHVATWMLSGSHSHSICHGLSRYIARGSKL